MRQYQKRQVQISNRPLLNDRHLAQPLPFHCTLPLRTWPKFNVVLFLHLGLIYVVCPGLCRLDYEPLVYDNDDSNQLLLSSRRVRRDEDGGEGSGLGEDYAAEDDDEDQEYFSSTELLPSRQPGSNRMLLLSRWQNCSGAGMFFPDPNFFRPGSEFFPARIPHPHQRI